MSDVQSRTPREVLALFQRAMTDWSWDDLADLYALDAVHEFPFAAPNRPERYHGREEVRAGYRQAWSASPVRLAEIHDVVTYDGADPEVIVGQWRGTGQNTATGEDFSATGLLILHVRDGLITRCLDYMDIYGTFRALGRLSALIPGA